MYEFAGTTRLSEPIALMLGGNVFMAGNKYEMMAFFDYHDFVANALGQEEYNPPRDIACENREISVTIPDQPLPQNFAFTSESVFIVKTDYGLEEVHVMPKQVHSIYTT